MVTWNQIWFIRANNTVRGIRVLWLVRMVRIQESHNRQILLTEHSSQPCWFTDHSRNLRIGFSWSLKISSIYLLSFDSLQGSKQKIYKDSTLERRKNKSLSHCYKVITKEYSILSKLKSIKKHTHGHKRLYQAGLT